MCKRIPSNIVVTLLEPKQLEFLLTHPVRDARPTHYYSERNVHCFPAVMRSSRKGTADLAGMVRKEKLYDPVAVDMLNNVVGRLGKLTHHWVGCIETSKGILHDTNAIVAVHIQHLLLSWHT